MSVKNNLIYSLIIIKLATCFDPIGSSSDLYYEPVNVRGLHTVVGSQQCLKITFYIYLCKHCWDSKKVRNSLTLTLNSRN